MMKSKTVHQNSENSPSGIEITDILETEMPHGEDLWWNMFQSSANRRENRRTSFVWALKLKTNHHTSDSLVLQWPSNKGTSSSLMSVWWTWPLLFTWCFLICWLDLTNCYTNSLSSSTTTHRCEMHLPTQWNHKTHQRKVTSLYTFCQHPFRPCCTLRTTWLKSGSPGVLDK